eukprot:Tbor_TRINITY_DN5282_c2_g1::TRINITY_DN5282_c2_g1_i1::g.16560::m.16560/K18204/D2HGDH; D-2-hydroxyglutarate dehydrogenase
MKHYAKLYPRLAAFKTITDADVTTLSNIVGNGSIIYNQEEALDPYNTDWLHQIQGSSKLAIFPKTTAQVSEIMKYCNKEKIAICPQGGNTGLVYGSTPIHDEVILSTCKMTSPLEIYPESFSAVIGAGVILETLQNKAEEKGFLAPLDLGAKGSCTLGGNISTNAGGIHYSRYGSMRSNVLALEAVTANGDIISTMQRKDSDTGGMRDTKAVRKDNVGYDLKQLFIGSEGTLGIVTKAEVQLHPYPKSKNVLLIHIGSSGDGDDGNMATVLQTFRLAKDVFGGILSAFEVMDTIGMQAAFLGATANNNNGEVAPIVDVLVSGVKEQISTNPTFGILIEVQGSDGANDSKKIEEFVDVLNDNDELVRRGMKPVELIDQVMATSESQVRNIWALREDLPVNLTRLGKMLKYDVCFPFDMFYCPVTFARRVVLCDLCGADKSWMEFTTSPQGHVSPVVKVIETSKEMQRLLREELIITGYGHFGDGNVHLNIIDATKDGRHTQYLLEKLSERIYRHVASSGGSVSAEHGIGMLKKNYMKMTRSQEWLDTMRGMKRLMDPNGIMNPYKML